MGDLHITMKAITKQTHILLFILAELALIQLCRMGLKTFAFVLVGRTILSDTLVNVAFMAAASGLLLQIAKKRSLPLHLFPVRYTALYVILTVFVAVAFLCEPFVTQSANMEAILRLVYIALVTPVFEEMLFRGMVWQQLESAMGKTNWMVNAALFGLWHLGYIDTILWRTSMFFPDANIPQIMFWKVMTGLVIGLILGFLRHKSKNAYPSILLHCLINTIGS